MGVWIVRVGVFLSITITASLGFWSVFGCAGPALTPPAGVGGDSTPTETSKSVISITGTVSSEMEATSTSAASASTGKGVGKSSRPELSCEAFTSEGQSLGSATLDSSGGYKIDVSPDLLKPTSADSDKWDARIFIKCADGSGKLDLRNYCESKIEEGKTLSMVCHATPDTTLATMDFLNKSGCQIGASCSVADVDPLCFIELQTAVYEAARSDATSNVKDEIAVVRELVGRCINAGHAELGYPSAAALVSAILDGALVDEQIERCGVTEPVRDKYQAGAPKVVTYMRDIFYADYAGDKASGKEGSPCALTRSDRGFAKKVVETYTLAENADALEKMKQSDIKKSIVNDLTQHCSSGSCDHDKIKPEVVIAKVKSKLDSEPVVVQAPKSEAPKSNPVTQILSSVKSEKTESKSEPKVEQRHEMKKEESQPVVVQRVVEEKKEEKKIEEKKVEEKKVDEKKVDEKKVEEDKDVTPPQILAVGPSAGTENVHRSSSVSVWFSEAIDGATINSATFYVADKNGNKVSGKLGYNAKTTTAFFVPDGYQSLAPYTIVVTTGVKDTSGNTLTENFASTFATTLEPPYGLITTGGAKSAVVSWSKLSGATSYNLYYSTSPDITTKTGTKIDKLKGTSYTFKGLKGGVTYYFLVTANHTNNKYETEASERTQETPMGFTTETIASKIGDVNQNIHSSMAMDSNGKIHIVYADNSGGKNTDLAYATNASGRWVHKIIDDGPFVGSHPHIKIDSNNYAHISYYGGNESSLKYATNAPSGKWTVETIDAARNEILGQYNSIALDGTSVHIAYWDMDGDLKYATNRGGPWVKVVVDDGEGAFGLPKSRLLGIYTNIQVDPAGTIHISYHDDTNVDLKYARKEINKGWVLELVDSEGNVGVGTSLAVDAALNVYIAYKDSTNDLLKLGKRINGKWEVITIEGEGVGYEPSIDIDNRGRLQISHRDNGIGAVKLATKGSAGWVSSPIAEDTSWGGYGTTLISDSRRPNASGKLHVLYTDEKTHELKYAYEN